MINGRSVQREIVRLRTRAVFREASVNENMVKPSRSTPSASKPSNETDVDRVGAKAPQQTMPQKDTLSNDSDKLDFLCREMSKVTELAKEIKELRRLNAEKDKRINELENKIDDLEQYSRQDNLIITGFNYHHLSYSRAANPDQETHNHENSTEEEKLSLENQVIELLQNHEIPIDKNSISACHTIPTKNRTNERPIVIRFTSRKAKINVLRNSWKLKKTSDPNDKDKQPRDRPIYINEHLTAKNNMIAKKARELKRKAIIEKTWVKNCKVFIKYKADNGDYKVMFVKNLDVLNAFSD